MCSLTITQVVGVDIQPGTNPGDPPLPGGIRISGTAAGCEAGPEYASPPGGAPMARLSASVPDLTGNSVDGQVFVPESAIADDGSFTWSIFIKGQFRCDAAVSVTAWCGEPDDGCIITDEQHVVLCNPNCPPTVTFADPVDAGCDEGVRTISVGASWSGDPTWANVIWFYGANKMVAGDVFSQPTSTVDLAFAPEDLLNPSVVLKLSPGCEHSFNVGPLAPCCPGPVELLVFDAAGELVDPAAGALPPGAYELALSGDVAAEQAPTAWTVREGDGPAQTWPGTEDGESSSILVVLDDEPLEVEVVVAADGCPEQSDRISLTPGLPDCPGAPEILVLNEDGKPIPVDPCLDPGTYTLRAAGDGVADAVKTWTTRTEDGTVTTTSGADLQQITVTLTDEVVEVELSVSLGDCPEVPSAGVRLEPCDDVPGSGGDPGDDDDPDDEPDDEPDDGPDDDGGDPGGGDDDDDDDETVTGGGFNWCAFWLTLMFIAMVIGAILLAIGVCLLLVPEPTTVTKWVGAILTIIGAILLVIGFVIFVVWLLTCSTLRVNCWLVDILIDVLVGLSAVSGIAAAVIAAIGGLMGPLCWVGVTIDAAYFGILLTISYWWARVIGCRPWPRWVPDWLRIRLPAWMRMGDG